VAAPDPSRTRKTYGIFVRDCKKCSPIFVLSRIRI